MKVCEAGYRILPQEENLGKKIEKIARLCYKSEDKITEDSYKGMIAGLVGRQHYAMLEHADMCLQMPKETFEQIQYISNVMETYDSDNPEDASFRNFLRFTKNSTTTPSSQISGNIRAWYEFAIKAAYLMNIDFSLIARYIDQTLQTDTLFTEAYVKELEKLGNKNYKLISFDKYQKSIILTNEEVEHPRTNETLTVCFTTDRGITHELVRHRTASFAQESTRYCNYSKGKFGEEITVVKPYFLKEKAEDSELYKEWTSAMENAEKSYFALIKAGAKPQEARDVLPTSTKAEIFITATLDEWIHIFELRACDKTGSAHPQVKEIMCPLLYELQHDAHYGQYFEDLQMSEETLRDFVPQYQKEEHMER